MPDLPKPPGGGEWDVIIDVYSRAQALADGVLIAVDPATCGEAGFAIPVALTSAVWADCVAWPDGQEAPQDEIGRLWDVLYMAHRAIIMSTNKGGRSLSYRITRVPVDGTEAELVDLVAEIGPGDEGEPVFTIRFPGED
jgi:uncharacterized protein DUF6573